MKDGSCDECKKGIAALKDSVHKSIQKYTVMKKEHDDVFIKRAEEMFLDVKNSMIESDDFVNRHLRLLYVGWIGIAIVTLLRIIF